MPASVHAIPNQQQALPQNQPQPQARVNTVKNPLPIYMELIQPPKQGATSYFDAFDFSDSNAQLLSTNNANERSYVQENSHLIQFDCCLLGCVFYFDQNELYYGEECLTEWVNTIQRVGGRCINDYDMSVDQITHVICPDRFSEIYKKVI